MKGDYTKKMYKDAILKFILENGYNAGMIGELTSDLLFPNRSEIDRELYEIMLDIMNMEEGPEFELTEKEFMEYFKKI